MPLSDLVTRLVRRWWAVVLGVLASIGLGVAAAALVPPTYGATASLLLLPPKPVATDGTATPAPFNPFLSLGGLDPAASVLVRSLNSGDFHDSVAPAGGTASFSVDPDTQASGPLLVVTVADATPDTTMALLRKVVAQAPITLDQIQTDTSVDPSVRIHVSEIAQVSQPTVDRRSQTRAVLAVVVVGLGATTVGTLLLDVLLMRRRARRRTVEGPGTADDPDDEGPGAAPAPAPGPATGSALERSVPAPSAGPSPERTDPYGAPWPPPSMVPDVLARPVGPFPEPTASHTTGDDLSTREIPRVTARMWSTAFAPEPPRRAHGRSSRARPVAAGAPDGTSSANDRRAAQESASDQDVDEHPLAPADAG